MWLSYKGLSFHQSKIKKTFYVQKYCFEDHKPKCHVTQFSKGDVRIKKFLLATQYFQQFSTFKKNSKEDIFCYKNVIWALFQLVIFFSKPTISNFESPPKFVQIRFLKSVTQLLQTWKMEKTDRIFFLMFPGWDEVQGLTTLCSLSKWFFFLFLSSFYKQRQNDFCRKKIIWL